MRLNAGKASLLALTGAFVVGVILLGNSLTTSVSAKKTDTPTPTPTPTPISCNHGYHEENGQCVHNGGGNGNCGQNQGNGNNGQDNGYGNGDECGTPTPTPTPTPPADPCAQYEGDTCPTSSPTATPTATPEPTATPGDVCWNLDGFQGSIPDGYHKDSPDGACNQYAFGGPPTSSGNGPQGQVLGASTMAGTGSFDENLYMSIMGLGAIITAFGFKNLKKVI